MARNRIAAMGERQDLKKMLHIFVLHNNLTFHI